MKNTIHKNPTLANQNRITRFTNRIPRIAFRIINRNKGLKVLPENNHPVIINIGIVTNSANSEVIELKRGPNFLVCSDRWVPQNEGLAGISGEGKGFVRNRQENQPITGTQGFGLLQWRLKCFGCVIGELTGDGMKGVVR